MRLELRMKYLETIYQRYRKASKQSKGKILDELFSVERETLEAISQAFWINIYVRTRKGGKLIALGNG